MKNYVKYLPYVTFILALISTLASLSFSEIFHLTPCVLCWYQRICMYPLVFISAVSIIRKQKDLHTYILPLSILGLLIAIYHNLLYWHILPESVAPCKAGISCTTKLIEYFGLITIPFGSMIAFALITATMLLYAKNIKNNQEPPVEKDKQKKGK
ncbi:MAG: disulfide bond formation protein B [Candidatus Levyibacteriota bacterium]